MSASEPPASPAVGAPAAERDEPSAGQTRQAALLSLVLALVVGAPALLGLTALDPQAMLDHDGLYAGAGPPPPLPPAYDPGSVMYEWPRDYAIARGLRQGRLDHWSPDIGLGAPLWAEQSGPFFPLKLIFYLYPSRLTYDLFRTLRLAVAALGAYLLARRRGCGHAPALAAGGLFAVSGGMLGQLPHAAMSATCMLPWALWALLGIASPPGGRSGRAVAIAGIVLGIAGSGGHPACVLVVAVTVAVFTTALLASHWREPRVAVRIGSRALLAGTIGAMLASPTLLPLVELSGLAHSYKEMRIGAWHQSMGVEHLRAATPLTLFAPGLLWPMRDEMITARPPLAIGVLALWAAMAGAWMRRDGGMVALLATWFALACAPFGWVDHVPVLRDVRACYLWPLAAVPLTQWAGDGLEALRRARDGRLATLAFLALVALATGAGVLLLAGPWDFYRAPTLRRVTTPIGLARTLVPFALAGCVAAAVAVRSRRRTDLPPWVAPLVLLEPLLLLTPLTWLPVSKVLGEPPSPAVRFLRDHLRDGDGRMLAGPVAVPQTPLYFGIPDARITTVLPLRRFVDFVRLVKVNEAQFMHVLPLGHYPIADLAAIRYEVVGHRGEEPPVLFRDQPQLERVYWDARVAVYENHAALPRARMVYEPVLVDDTDRAWREMLYRLRRPASAPNALPDVVLLEPDAAGKAAPWITPPTRGARFLREVHLEDASDPDRLVLSARTARPGFVLVADTYHPGWRATVDGEAAPVYPANVAFRAVFVPAGEHRIVFSFVPRAFHMGLCLFAAAACACAVLVRRGARNSESRLTAR